MAAGLLPAIIDRFSCRYPEVVIHVVDALAGMQEFRELRQRNVELMLARVPEPVVDKDVEVDVLFEEHFSLSQMSAARGPVGATSRLQN
jgi:DNA-binding transcriptional LysR family regulator